MLITEITDSSRDNNSTDRYNHFNWYKYDVYASFVFAMYDVVSTVIAAVVTINHTNNLKVFLVITSVYQWLIIIIIIMTYNRLNSPDCPAVHRAGSRDHPVQQPRGLRQLLQDSGGRALRADVQRVSEEKTIYSISIMSYNELRAAASGLRAPQLRSLLWINELNCQFKAVDVRGFQVPANDLRSSVTRSDTRFISVTLRGLAPRRLR